MDPATVITTIITVAGAACKSYKQKSDFVTLVRNAPKELDGVRSRASSINGLVANLKQALEESAIWKVIKRDALALSHVKALDEPLRAVECKLDEVMQKLIKYYKCTTDGKHDKIRWQYFFAASDWNELQSRLSSHIQILSASMQGLNTLKVLRVLGPRDEDPASTLRTYAKSILETSADEQDRTLVGRRTPSPLPSQTVDPVSPFPLDERRLLARKKVRLQRELLQAATQYGHLRVAELLDSDADTEAKCDAFGNDWIVRTEKGRTPLLWAASGRNCHLTQERMCRLLLDKGVDPNARNIFSRTALQEAAMSVRWNNNIDPRPTIELLLGRGAYINAFDINSWTALTKCAYYGKLEVAKLLLSHGVHVDGKPGKEDPVTVSNPDLNRKIHETPLVICAEITWNEDLIFLLLDKGADTEGQNKEGKTMGELAAEAKGGVVLDRLGKLR